MREHICFFNTLATSESVGCPEEMDLTQREEKNHLIISVPKKIKLFAGSMKLGSFHL